MKNPIIMLLCGILLGILLLGGIRFALVKDDSVHYHANFELYINGVRDEFKSPLLYEEEQSCDVHNSDNPRTRVHMHEPDNSVVHVHDNAVTWNAFLNNIGYDLGDNYIKTGGLLFQNGNDNGATLTFILNGQTVPSVANTVIKDQDTLLINYGTEDATTLQQRFKVIPNDAKKHDEEKDPATCSGTESLTFSTRLKKAFSLTE